jgi:hypothetical protein
MLLRPGSTTELCTAANCLVEVRALPLQLFESLRFTTEAFLFYSRLINDSDPLGLGIRINAAQSRDNSPNILSGRPGATTEFCISALTVPTLRRDSSPPLQLFESLRFTTEAFLFYSRLLNDSDPLGLGIRINAAQSRDNSPNILTGRPGSTTEFCISALTVPWRFTVFRY